MGYVDLKMKNPKYSIEVYEDHAIIRGKLSSDMLILLLELCKDEGFTHMTNPEDGSQGFKLVKNDSRYDF